MRQMDLSPFRRSSIGFDRMLDMLSDTERFDHSDYPPYDIVKTGENTFSIELAVPGYKRDEIEMVAHQNVLHVVARAPQQGDTEYVHRGIPRQGFERRFNLADYVEVKTASIENGILRIDLAREVPEAMKPRKINIAA